MLLIVSKKYEPIGIVNFFEKSGGIHLKLIYYYTKYRYFLPILLFDCVGKSDFLSRRAVLKNKPKYVRSM